MKTKIVLMMFGALMASQSIFAAEEVDFSYSVTVCIKLKGSTNRRVEFVKYLNQRNGLIQYNSNYNDTAFEVKNKFFTHDGKFILKYSAAGLGQKYSDPRFQETLVINPNKLTGKRIADINGKLLDFYSHCKSFHSADDIEAMTQWLEDLRNQ